MKKHAPLKQLLLSSTIAATLAIPQASMASPWETFDRANMVSDHELEESRGKFISVGGLEIEFGLQTRSLIDGVVQADTFITSNNLENVDVNALRQVIQVGGNNSTDALNELVNNPSLITVIQNSEDSKLIQNFSVLDLDVANIDSFRAQQLATEVDLQAADALQ